MKINTRDDLKQYVLKRLGAPVIRINVEESQLQDRIDDAILYFQTHSSESQNVQTKLHVITQDDVDRKAIIVPDDIIAINSMCPITPGITPLYFSPEYQFFILELRDLMNGSLENYYIVQSHMNLLNFLLSKYEQPFNFNQYTHELRIYQGWNLIRATQSVLVYEGIQKIDPSLHPGMYNNYYLKELTYAFVLRQWAQNLKKYSNVPLVGGAMLNAADMLAESDQMLKDLVAEMKMTSDAMPFFRVA